MSKRNLLLTGAVGGMGKACARLLGATHNLVLTGRSAPALEAFASELTREGYCVAQARAGDLEDDALLDALVSDLGGGSPFTLVHTAGVSTSLGDWRTIMRVNLVTTAKLLDRVEAVLCPGSVGVLISSTAAYLRQPSAELQVVLDKPTDPDFLDRLSPMVEVLASTSPAGINGVSYGFSKQTVLRMVEQRAARWGAAGARILSISPGLVMTPMGHKELEKTPGARDVFTDLPVGRAGRPIEIALAAQFLASDAASFITGCDLRMDGGLLPKLRFN